MPGPAAIRGCRTFWPAISTPATRPIPFANTKTWGSIPIRTLGYAYYFTRDPKFLPLAKKELDAILPFAGPLANPQEINTRLYNPYAPARTFAVHRG